jgi:hypothetical protein
VPPVAGCAPRDSIAALSVGNAEDQVKLLKITTLDKGWCDRDEVLLHAAFQVFVDFVEREHPDRTIDWNADEVHRHVWKEIKSLYKWWKETRPSRHSPLDDEHLAKPPLKFKQIPGSDFSQVVEPDKKKYAAYYRALKRHGQLELKWYEEDQRNLHRLIEIRGHLWT